MPSRRVSADGSLAEQLLDLGGVRGGNDLVAREAAREAARLALEQVATARLLTHDLAGPGDPEPLLGAGVRLVLRHWRALLHLARSQVRPGWLVGSKPLVRTGCPRTSGRPSSRARAWVLPSRGRRRPSWRVLPSRERRRPSSQVPPSQVSPSRGPPSRGPRRPSSQARARAPSPRARPRPAPPQPRRPARARARR